MPITFSTCLERDLLLAKWSGRLTLEEFKTNYFDYISDEYYRAGRTELIDQRDFEDFEGDFQLVQSALNFVNRAGEGPKTQTRTVVVAPQGGIFGLGRMYQQFAEMTDGIQVEVYTSESEALAKLELPYASIEELVLHEKFLPAHRRSDLTGPSG